MGRGVTRVTRALAVALMLGAATAQAQTSQIAFRFQSYYLPERSTGLWSHTVYVDLPSGPPASSDVTVNWSLVAGSASATPGNDYVMASGTLTFTALVESTETINVQINGDTIDEWTLPQTYHQDEVFFIQLSNPSANAVIQKGRSTITLIDDDRPMPGLQFLAAVAGGNSTAGQNKLLWRVPAAPTQPSDVLIRWNTGPACSPPATAGEVLSGTDAGQGFFVANFLNTMGGAGALQSWVHPGRQLNTQYCYSLFTYYGATPTPEPMTVKATPFDATPPAREAWRYSPGCYLPCAAATLAPPTVGFDAIYSVDNDGVVHAMQRGPAGGAWPPSWNPLSLGKPTQSRSPAVPMKVTPLSDWRVFIGTDGGGLHAVDGQTGTLVWSRSAAFSNALPSSTTGTSQAPPAGIFVNYGGNSDRLLVGTNNGLGNNVFLQIDPYTGTTLAPSYTDPAMGNVTGMAVADYSGAIDRVYFVASSPGARIVALDVPGFAPSALPGGNPTPLTTGTLGSAILRGNRLVFGDSAAKLQGRDLGLGTNHVAEPTGDGNVKGFVWPDRRDDRIYFATDTLVQGMRETGSAFVPLWTLPFANPSPVLQKPGTDFLYVGDGNGRLVEINVSNQFFIAQPLEGPTDFLGAPSLDNAYGIVLVGSVKGTIHAVRVPF
jgi:hypothetical protein